MKRFGILVALAGLGLSVAFCGRLLAQETKADKKVARRDDAGKLEVDRMMYDFGSVPPGARVTGKFMLTNTGAEMLQIKDPIRTQCGCTKPKLKQYKLKPGESVPMQVTFTAPKKAGKVTKSIYVSILAPGKPAKITLKITADVRKKLSFKPDQWVFELRESKANAVPVELTSPDGKPFSIVRYTSTQNAVKVIFDPNARALKHVLPIEVDLETLTRVRDGAVTIWTDHGTDKKLTIEYRTKPTFKAVPGTVYLRNLKRGESRDVNMVVLSSYGEEFEVGEVSSEKGFIQLVSTEKREDGYGITIRAKVPLSSKLKVIKDYLIIKIKDHPLDSIRTYCILAVEDKAKRGG